MKVLVTGGCGNVGRSTLRELQACHHEVTCLDIPTKKNKRQAESMPGILFVWGDITDKAVVRDVISGQEAIVHLAAIIPPASDDVPERAEAVNVGGTRNILDAIVEQERPPRLIFSSSFDLFGPTQDQDPPRKVTDPVVETDAYTGHKLACEEMIKGSGIDLWAIFRFADVPPMEARKFHPIMFRIPLDQRFEVVHPDDVALAIANGLGSEIWGKTWLVGGGPSCQIRYGDYLREGLRQAGFGENVMLPPEAFSTEAYCTDWLDSSETQALLQYQRHSFDEIMTDVDRAVATSAISKWMVSLASPLVRAWILSRSPYYKDVKKNAVNVPVVLK